MAGHFRASEKRRIIIVLKARTGGMLRERVRVPALLEDWIPEVQEDDGGGLGWNPSRSCWS
ncbi:hypothetical protein CRG98_041211 [Punica granatum]|uniref:Uncharacterized protein n=1 Tax=Punica granatum TaxID=22663 RepID=A0A2I0I4M8_PUNGR|nr:hypothetical protein CRG98_041211 [Punica granatum]